MKRLITPLLSVTLVVACFCAPLAVGADFVGIGGNYPSGAIAVGSVYDYGYTYGYYEDATNEFIEWVTVSNIEYNLRDSAFLSEDVSVKIENVFDDYVDFELHYYPDDPYHITTTLYWELAENDPDITSVWSWRFDDAFVIPDLFTLDMCPVAYCFMPWESDPSFGAYITYSYDYYDGFEWVHVSYLTPILGTADLTINLFPERAESQLLRNLVTTITFEDSYVDDYAVGVTGYGMPYYLGEKSNNVNYVDPATYAINEYGVIDGSRISFTGFLGNALGGVFDVPLFKIDDFEFTIGGLLGICIGMGVLMVVLKKFAGG